MTLRVVGGAAGAGARLADLDALSLALVDASADCTWLVGAALRQAVVPVPPAGVVADPGAVVALTRETAATVTALCRSGRALASLASAVATAAGGYRTRELAIETLLGAVPVLVAPAVRAGAATAALLAAPVVVAGTAAVVGARALDVPGAPRVVDGAVAALTSAVVRQPGAVDVAVRLLPAAVGTDGLAGLPAAGAGGVAAGGGAGVPALARVLSAGGQVSGLLVETPVRVAPVARHDACGAPAAGVADLLRRGQSVASWRDPGPAGHDTLPDGAARPVRGQVRIDRVTGADGALAWVVHVPGTQEWDGDGHGSPMDMAANVALVGGTDSAVAAGVAAAMVGAGVRPGDRVALVGHSQGGMTALDLAADPRVARVGAVSHVITAGSPLAGRTPPPGVQVLALEHPEDLVPRLDGRVHPDRADRVTVRAPAPDGPWRSDDVPAHSSSAYVATAERVDASDHPSLVAYRDGLAPFLDREGARCTSTHVVLTRDR